MTAVLAPGARRDLLQAARWIARDNPRAAEALTEAVLEAAERIGAHPAIGLERPDLATPPVRFLTLSGFPYVMVYDSDLCPPLVLRVIHGARDLAEVLRDI